MAENLQGCELSAYSLAMSIVTQNKDLTEALIRYSNETNIQQLYADALREGAAQGVEGGIKKNASKATLKSQSADVKFKSILYGSVLANTAQGDDALRQLMKAMEDSGENIAVGNRLVEMMKDLDISEINAIAKALGTNADEAELAIKGFKEKVAYYNGTNYSFITNGDMVKAKKATKDKEKEINKARDVLKRAEEKASSVGKDVKKMVDDDLSRLDKEAEEYANEKIKGIILTENQRQEKIAMYKKTYFNTTKGKATLNELQNKYGIKGGTYLKVKQGIEEIKNADNVIKDTKSRISILEKEYREMLNADLESIKHGQNPYNYIETGDTWRFTKSFDAEPSQRMADYGHYMLARTLLSDTSGDLPDSVYKIIEDTVKQQTNKGLENYMGVELTDEWILDSNRTLEELMSRAYMNTKDLIENGQLRTLYRQRLIELATDGRLINDDINFVESLIKTAKFAEAGEGFSSILLDNMLARTAQGMGIDIKNVDGKQIRNGILKVFGAQDFNKQITSGKPIHIFGNINVDSRQLLELSASMVGDLNVYKVIAKDNWDDNTLLQVVGSYLSGGKSGGDKRFIKLLTTVKETPTTDDTLGVILKATTGFDVPKGTEIAFYDFRKKYHTTEETSARAKFMDRLTEGNSITISDTITDITKNETALLDELKKKKWDKGGFIIVNGSDWKQDDVLYQTLKSINEGRSDEKKIQVIFPKGKGAESFSLSNGKLVYKTTSPKAMDAFLQKTAIRTMGSTLSDSRITEDIMERLAKGDIEAVAEYNKLLEEDAKNYFAQMLGTTADDENLIPLIEQKTGILFKNYDALKNKQEFWKLVDSKFTLAERVTGRYSSVVEKVEDIVLRGKTITAEEMSKDLTHEYGFDISPEILKKGDDIPENIRNAYTNLQLSENVGEYLENKGRLLAVINGSDGGVIPMSNFKDMFASGDYSTYKQLFFGNVDMTDEELAKYVNQINDMIFDGLTQQVANNLIDMGFELPGGINLKEAVYNQLKGKLGANSPFAQAFLYKNGLQDSTVTVQSILDDALPESLNFNFDKNIALKDVNYQLIGGDKVSMNDVVEGIEDGIIMYHIVDKGHPGVFLKSQDVKLTSNPFKAAISEGRSNYDILAVYVRKGTKTTNKPYGLWLGDVPESVMKGKDCVVLGKVSGLNYVEDTAKLLESSWGLKIPLRDEANLNHWNKLVKESRKNGDFSWADDYEFMKKRYDRYINFFSQYGKNELDMFRKYLKVSSNVTDLERWALRNGVKYEDLAALEMLMSSDYKVGSKILNGMSFKDFYIYEKGNGSIIAKTVDDIGYIKDIEGKEYMHVYNKYGRGGKATRKPDGHQRGFSFGERVNPKEYLDVKNVISGLTSKQLYEAYGIPYKIVEELEGLFMGVTKKQLLWEDVEKYINTMPEGEREAMRKYYLQTELKPGDNILYKFADFSHLFNISVELTEGILEGTLNHELWHAVANRLGGEKYKSIIDKAGQLYGYDPKLSEEMLADCFSEYSRTGKFTLPKDEKIFKKEINSLYSAIKDLFERIKKWLTSVDEYHDELQLIFDDVLNLNYTDLSERTKATILKAGKDRSNKIKNIKKKHNVKKIEEIPSETLIDEGISIPTIKEVPEVTNGLPVGYINRIVKEDNQFLPSNSYSALTSMAIADKGTTLPFIGNEKAILEGILNKYKTSLEQATQGKAISFAEAQKLKLQASYALDMFEQDYLASKYRRFLTPREQGELFGLKYNLGVATRNTDLAQIEQMNKAIIDRYNNATKRIINTNNDIIKGFVKGDKGIRAELEARQKELLQQGATLKEVNGTIVVVDSRDEIMRGINSLPNTILGLDIIKNIGRAGLEQLTNEQAYFLMNLIDLSKVMENKNNLIQQTIYRLKPQLAKIDFFNRFAVEDGIPMALSGLLLGGKYFSKYDNLNVFDDAVKRNIFSQIKDEFSKNGRLTKNKEKRWLKGKGNEAYEVLEGIIDNAISANMHQLKGNITDIKTFKANAKKAYMDAFNPYTILEDVPQGVKDNIDNILKEQQEGLRGAMSLLGSDDELTSIIDNIYIRQYNGDVISMRNALDGGTPDMNKVLFDTDSNYIIAADEAAGKKINPEWSETKKRNVEKENRDTARVVENSYLEGLNSYLNNSEFISAREKELRDRVGITARQAVEKYSTTRKFSEFDNAVTGLNDEIVRDIKSEILGFFGDITEGGNNWLSRGKIKTNIQEDIMFRWEKFKDKYSSIYSLSPEQLSVYKPKDKLDKAALNMVVYFKEMEKRLGSVNGMTGVSLDTTINKAFNHIGEVVTNIRDVRGVMSLMSGIEGNQAFKFFQFSNSNDASFVAKLRYKGETDDWGKLAGYRKYVDKNDLGMDLVTFNNTFGTNFDDSEYKLVMQGLTGATMIDKGWRWLHDIISVVNGSNYFSRALLSYPGQLFTVANQSIGYFLKQIGFEKSLGMENIYDIDRVRKESGILNGAYNEINWFRKYANYDSDDVLNSFNRYGIPDVEDAYKKMDIYTTDDVESIYGKFDEYFSRDEGNWFYRWVNKVSRNTDAYKDNANNIIDGVFARNFKNIAFEKALGDNRVMKFATAQQFEEFMKSNAPKSLKDAVMNAIQESSGRNFKNMLGIGFSGLDKTLSGVSNNMLGLMNMFNFRGAWGRNIFRQTNDFIQGAMHMARTGLDEEGITAITSYIARQPEFVNFTTQMFNDIVASWKLVRYQDNGKRNEIDNEYNLMDFLEYMSDNMKFVSQTMQGLSSYGLSRIVGDVFESTFMSMRNPEIYRDYYGVGALFNSIAKNFGRNWKVTNYFAKAIAVASTRGWDAAKEDLRNEFWKLSFGSMRYLLESEQNSGGFAAGLIGDQRKGIPGILTGEPDEGGDKQFSYDIANTETWENVKSRFDAVTSGDLDSAKIYRTNQFQSFLNASQLGGVIKGTLQTVRGLGFENLNKLIGDIGVFDVATPYDMGQLCELIDATNVGHTMLTEGTYRPKTAKEVRTLIDEVIYRGEHRPGNKSFNKDVFNFENYGHMGGTDYTKDYDLDMEQLLMNMKYERNGDFSFKVDKDGNKIVTQDWKDYMYVLKDHANDEEYLINANYQHVFNWVESNRNDPNYMLYQSLIGEGIANKFLEDEADKYIDSYNKAYGLKKSQKLTATELKDSIWYDEVVPYLMTANMSINGQHSNFIDGLMDLSRPATEAAQMKMIINELKEKGNEDISKFFKVSEGGDIKMSKKFSNYILEQGKLSNYIDEGDLDSFITETASITNMYQKEDPYGIMTTTLLSARVNRINQANNLTAEQKAKAINTLFASNYEFIQKHIPEMIDELGYDAAKTYIDAMNTSLYDISKIGTQLTKENEANNSSSGRGSSVSTVKLVNNSLSKIANTAEKAGITPANTNYKFDLVPVKINGSELLKKTGGKGHSVDNVGVYVVKYTPHSRFEIDKDVSRRVKKTSTQAVSTKKQLSNIEAKTEKALTAEA